MNLSDCIKQMLEYKESIGFARQTYESYLKNFQVYFEKAGCTAFTEDSVLPWCEKRDTETPEGFQRRLTPLREFSKYLYAMGCELYRYCVLYPSFAGKAPCLYTDKLGETECPDTGGV